MKKLALSTLKIALGILLLLVAMPVATVFAPATLLRVSGARGKFNGFVNLSWTGVGLIFAPNQTWKLVFIKPAENIAQPINR